MTTLWDWRSSATFLWKASPVFFARTLSLCVCAKPKRCARATAIVVLPVVVDETYDPGHTKEPDVPQPGMAIGTSTVFVDLGPCWGGGVAGRIDSATCSPSGVSLHLRNASLTAMIPRLC